MPKLPIEPTNASMPPAASCGIISGSTIVRTMRQRPRPRRLRGLDEIARQARAVRRARRGRRPAPARGRAASTMPPGPYSGCGCPGAGAIPSACSSVLFGPSRLIHASAVTCGAISSGIMKQKTSAFLARRSVNVTSSANADAECQRERGPAERDRQRVAGGAPDDAGFRRRATSTPGSKPTVRRQRLLREPPNGTTASRTTKPSERCECQPARHAAQASSASWTGISRRTIRRTVSCCVRPASGERRCRRAGSAAPTRRGIRAAA